MSDRCRDHGTRCCQTCADLVDTSNMRILSVAETQAARIDALEATLATVRAEHQKTKEERDRLRTGIRRLIEEWRMAGFELGAGQLRALLDDTAGEQS